MKYKSIALLMIVMSVNAFSSNTGSVVRHLDEDLLQDKHSTTTPLKHQLQILEAETQELEKKLELLREIEAGREVVKSHHADFLLLRTLLQNKQSVKHNSFDELVRYNSLNNLVKLHFKLYTVIEEEENCKEKPNL